MRLDRSVFRSETLTSSSNNILDHFQLFGSLEMFLYVPAATDRVVFQFVN